MSNDQEKKNLNFDDTIYQIEDEEAYLWLLNLINAKYTPGKDEDLSDKKDGFIPFLKVFDYLKDNNIPLLPWSYIYQNAHIYNQNVESSLAGPLALFQINFPSLGDLHPQVVRTF